MIKPIIIFIELVSVSGNPNFVYKNITENPAEQPKINATKVFFIYSPYLVWIFHTL